MQNQQPSQSEQTPAQNPQSDAQPQPSQDQQAQNQQSSQPQPSQDQSVQAQPQQAPTQPQQQAQQGASNPQESQQKEANAELEKLDQQQEETSNTFASKNISKESASMLNLLMEQIKTLVEVSNNLNERTKEVEKRINELTVDSEKSKEESKIINEKMDMMEKNMEKFIGLYEVVTNQYNPFLESSNSTVEEEEEIDSDDVQVQSPPPSQNTTNAQDSNKPELPTASSLDNQNQNQEIMPNSGASFHFEDRITGEKAFVGQQEVSPNQNTQGQSFNQFQSQPQQQGFNQNFQPQQSPQVQPQHQGSFMNQNQPQNNMQSQNQGNPNPDYRAQNPLSMPTQKTISTLQDMLEELAIMDDNSFFNLVNGQRNDIANWVMNSLGNLELGTELLKCKSRIETIKALSRYIHNRPPEPPQTTDFRLNNGKVVNDIEGMLDELIYIDDATFSNHVNPQKNDVADWLQGSLKQQDLANRVRGLMRKTDIIRELALFLHSNN